LLGFRIHPSGQVSPAPKAIERLKDRVRMLWDARLCLSTQQLRDQWQRDITGWWNDYGYANWRRVVHALSGWIRRHMRQCFRLRWHNRHGRRKALERLAPRGSRTRPRGGWLSMWAPGSWRATSSSTKR